VREINNYSQIVKILTVISGIKECVGKKYLKKIQGGY
jgi:hypothetical protein